MKDLFSKRQKRARGEASDVYQYKEIPRALRVQIVHIWQDVLGDPSDFHYSGARDAYKYLQDTLCREYGVFQLQERAHNPLEAVVNFFLQTEDVDQAIDVVELSFSYIERVGRQLPHNRYGVKLLPHEGIAELNARFREHGVGYQYESGQMVKVSSQLIHADIVQPALRFLEARMYRGANQEFLSAHSHYRAGETEGMPRGLSKGTREHNQGNLRQAEVGI